MADAPVRAPAADTPGAGAGTSIIAATGIAGIAGLLTTTLVARAIGAEAYAPFSIFWAAVYLIVGTLSGIQQEMTRAVSRVDAVQTGRSPLRYAVAVSVVVLIGALLLGGVWAADRFEAGALLAVPFAIGVASYALVAAVAGCLFGLARWRAIVALLLVDALGRLALLLVLVLFTDDLAILAWGVALPFPLAVLLVLPAVRRDIVGSAQLDVGYRALTWNAARTTVAAASTGLLVSGFPALLEATSSGVPAAELGAIVLAITLSRAPIVVSVMALQGLVIVRVRDLTRGVAAFTLRVGMVIGAATAVLAGAGWLLGPWALEVVIGSDFVVAPSLIALLIATSGLVGLLTLVGAVLLARGRHMLYGASWLVAAGVTTLTLLLPGALEPRVVLALTTGPVAGLLVSGIGLVVALRRGR